MFNPTALQHLGWAAIYAVLGVVIFAITFIVIDKVTPGSLWKELIEEHNNSVAILFGCWAIALGIIIAAAIHTT